MKPVLIALLLNLVLPITVIARPMTEAERTQIKVQLDTILKANQDECYVNASNFNNIDVLALASNKEQKTMIEKTSRNLYLRGNLSATLNIDVAETMLPEGSISTESSNRIVVNYRRAVSLNPVEIKYAEIETQNFAEGFVTHVFETQGNQNVWKYSLVDLYDAQTKKPHVRCKAKGDDGFQNGKSIVKPIQTNSFKFLDLEFIIPEYCLTQCSDLTVKPIQFQTH